MATTSAKQGVRAAKLEMYRQLVLDAAEAEFAERGYEEARIQHVARRAGIALGTLYGVFPGKQEIYLAVQKRRGPELLECVVRGSQGSGGVLQACLSGLGAYVRFMTTHLNYLRMHLRAGLAWSEPDTLVGAEAQTWERGVALSCDLFRQGIESGDFYPGEPRVLVRMIAAAHQVQLRHWVDQGADSAHVDALVADMRQHFLRAFVRPEAVQRARIQPVTQPNLEEQSHAHGAV